MRSLEWRPLAVVGIASYSLYLWHPPIVQGLTDGADAFLPLLAVAAPLCIVAALLSYTVIESPFLSLRRRWARSSARTSAGKRSTRAEPA